MQRKIEDCVLLYVEDDDASAYLMQIALQRSRDASPRLVRVSNAHEAVSFLMQEPPYLDAPRPDLVLLDLNLPGKGGFDLLQEIKSQGRFQDLRVVVFTSSILPDERTKSLAIGAEDFIHKSLDFEEFVAMAARMCEKMTSEMKITTDKSEAAAE